MGSGAKGAEGSFLLSLPPHGEGRPSGRDRLSAYVMALAPWLAVYLGVQALGRPAHPLSVQLPFERSWPVFEWTEILYASGYVLVPLVPLLAPTQRALRLFVVTGLLATVVVGGLWVAVPVVAVPRPFVPETVWGRFLAAERSWSAHVAAFPSFHVLWALIAADTLRLRSPRWAVAAWSWAALITLSCATTGQHAVVDLLAALLLFVPIRRAGALLSGWGAATGRPAVKVHKWYLDCTTDGGEAAVVYVGTVSFGPLQFPYFELLTLAPGQPARRLRRLSRDARVTSDGVVVELSAPLLGVAGRWQRTTRALDVVLLEGAGGTIRWLCHQPGGTSELQLPDGRRLTGAGYVEELVMTVPPWALPLEELRWGRFSGGGHSVVWIDWRGPLERRWLFVDGEPREVRHLGAEGIEWAAGRLDVARGVVLREARIGRTLAGPFAFLLPRRLGRAVETKWLSRGSLHVGAGEPVRGSVLHEVVRWA